MIEGGQKLEVILINLFYIIVVGLHLDTGNKFTEDTKSFGPLILTLLLTFVKWLVLSTATKLYTIGKPLECIFQKFEFWECFVERFILKVCGILLMYSIIFIS